MTVIMYLTGLSQSFVVNTASQPGLRERMTAICSFAGSALALRRPICGPCGNWGHSTVRRLINSMKNNARVFPAPHESQYVLRIRSLSVQQEQWGVFVYVERVATAVLPCPQTRQTPAVKQGIGF